MIGTSKIKYNFEKSLSFSDDKTRDLSVAVKCFLLLKNHEYANEYLKLILNNIGDLKNSTSYGLALWAICGGAREIESIHMDIDTNQIEELVTMLENNVKGSAPHWLYGGQSDNYLSNIAISYGALKEALTIIDNDGARKHIIALRDYAFKSFLKGGNLISIAEGDTRFGDLPACAVPFCMFGAEDRVLVESMEEESQRFFGSNDGIGFRVEDRRNRELTLLLAWYFAEKGDIEKGDLIRAKALYGIAAEMDPSEGKQALCIILSAIVEQVLNMKENQSGEFTIIHIPMGTNDPYYTSLHERSPRLPIETESVIINAEILPSIKECNVQLEYNNNNLPPIKMNMKKQNSDAGAQYYSADMGSFKFADKVSYKITAVSDENQAVSKSFTFNTAKWFHFGEIIGAKHMERRIAVYFERDKESDIAPVLFIKPNGKTASLEFVFQKLTGFENLLTFETFRIEDFCITVKRNAIFVCEKDSEKLIVSMQDRIISCLHNGEDVICARLSFGAKPGENYYGMGERYSCIEYRGLVIDNYVYNQYRNQGMKTYMPCPFYTSSEGYGVYLNSDSYSTFDFCCTDPNTTTIEGYCKEGKYKLDLYIGSSKEILGQHIIRTGLPELPPVWAFGPWMSSNNWDSQQEVLHQVEMTKKHDIPSTVLVIEQWSDEATFYIFNDAKYTLKDGKERLCARDFEFSKWGRWVDPKSMVDELHQQGIKVLLWQVPIHKYMSGVSHPQRDEDVRVMIEEGYCVRNADGAPYRIPYGWFAGSLVLDFTSPEARRWWLGKRRYLLEDIGIDGFKTDGGECILGDGLQFADGTLGREMHNRYVLDYIGAYNSYVKEVKGEGITFSRAGYVGSQKMPMHWAGDEHSTWEAFRSSIRAGISAGLSGIIFWGWDLAGFHGEIPTAELYIRSAQMAAFCPVMQYHAETKGEFNRDRTPWNIADRTEDMRAISIYRKFAILRMNLLPYIYSEAVYCTQNMEPLMRAMSYEFPDERECLKLDMQYMFGRNLLVAPITEEGQTVNRVYIPQGRWHDILDNKVYEKLGYYDIKASIDRIPVFVKDNSVIPLNLNNSLELFGNVGNNVEYFENLCFDIRLKDKILASFDFKVIGQVKMEVERIGNEIVVNTIADQPIILRFWNESMPQNIFIGEQKYVECDSIANNLTWCYREGQIIIKAEKGTGNIRVVT